MGIIATTLKHLIAAGVTGDALVMAIEEIENAQPVMSGVAKSSAAIRQERYREKKRNETVTNRNKSVTGHNESVTNVTDVMLPKDSTHIYSPNLSKSVTSDVTGITNVTNNVTGDALPSDGSDGFPNPSLTSLTPHKENPLKGSKEKPQERGSSMAEDFEFPEKWQEWAAQNFRDATAQEITELFIEFRNYWCAIPGARGRKRNWYTTWQNRVKEKLTKKGQNYGNFRAKPSRTEPPAKPDYRKGTEGFQVIGGDDPGDSGSEEGSLL